MSRISHPPGMAQAGTDRRGGAGWTAGAMLGNFHNSNRCGQWGQQPKRPRE